MQIATEKIETLDTRIAGLLKNPNDVSSSVFANILAEIGRAIIVAEKAGREAQARAFDPSILDPTAIGKSHDATYTVQRLRNATIALTKHHEAAIKRAAWESEAAPIREQVDELAAYFNKTYTEAGGALVTCFRKMAALDKLVDALNAKAPGGMGSLRSVEATARSLDRIQSKPFLQQVHLPVLARTFESASDLPLVWPPAQPNHVLDYANSISRMLQGQGAPPPPTEAERLAERARQMEFIISQEQGREAKNAAAAEAIAARAKLP